MPHYTINSLELLKHERITPQYANNSIEFLQGQASVRKYDYLGAIYTIYPPLVSLSPRKNASVNIFVFFLTNVSVTRRDAMSTRVCSRNFAPKTRMRLVPQMPAKVVNTSLDPVPFSPFEIFKSTTR